MPSSKSKPQTGGRPVPRAEMLWCLLAMFVGSFQEPRPGRIQKVDPLIWEPLLLEGTLWNHPSGIYYNLGTLLLDGTLGSTFGSSQRSRMSGERTCQKEFCRNNNLLCCIRSHEAQGVTELGGLPTHPN